MTTKTHAQDHLVIRRALSRAGARARWVIAFAVAAALVVTAPATGLAQEFQKVDGTLADEIPAVPFVGIAYGFIWLAVLIYVVVLARGLGRVKTEIDDLRRKLDSAETTRK